MKVALDPSDPAFATRSAVIHFDKGLVFNSAKFPSCTEAHVRSGAVACAKAKVGGGKAAGLALGRREDLTVTAYDGPGGKAVLLHVTGTKPLKIDSVIVGKLVPDSGAFGRKLAQGLLGRQAEVQGRLRLHRRLQAVPDVDRRLREVARARQPTYPRGRASAPARRAPRQRVVTAPPSA
jgi:hypothetical protein